MNHRVVAGALCGLVLLGVLAGYVLLAHQELIPWCLGQACASDRVLFGVAQPLYRGTWPLILLTAVLITVDRDTFYAWLRHASILAVAGTCLVIAAEPVQTGFFPGPFPDRTRMTLLVSLLITLVSGGYVLVRKLHERRGACALRKS